jgi:myosin-crossreactive antigen
LAFTDQFCDLPDDVVFTVEDPVLLAQAAVYALPSIEESSTRASLQDVHGIARPAFVTAALGWGTARTLRHPADAS